MTDTPIDREAVEQIAQALDRFAWEGAGYAADMMRALLDAKEAAEAERDEAINQLDSARHSVGVLERRCGEFRDRAEAAEAERDRALIGEEESEGNLNHALHQMRQVAASRFTLEAKLAVAVECLEGIACQLTTAEISENDDPEIYAWDDGFEEVVVNSRATLAQISKETGDGK